MIHTNKMVKMMGLWLPEVCAWEYSKGCLMARYLQKDIKGFGEIRKKNRSKKPKKPRALTLWNSSPNLKERIWDHPVKSCIKASTWMMKVGATFWCLNPWAGQNALPSGTWGFFRRGGRVKKPGFIAFKKNPGLGFYLPCLTVYFFLGPLFLSESSNRVNRAFGRRSWFRCSFSKKIVLSRFVWLRGAVYSLTAKKSDVASSR